jgi:hypothetical protein
MTERLRFPIVGSRMIAQAHARAHRTTDSLTATRRAMASGTRPVGHQLVNGRAVRATRRLAQFLVEDLGVPRMRKGLYVGRVLEAVLCEG